MDYVLDDLLRQMPGKNASDLHLRVDEPPLMRVHGDLARLPGYAPLTPEDVRELLYSILNEAQREALATNLVVDLAYEIRGVARWRVNFFHQQGVLGGVLRMIPANVQTIDELGLPAVLKDLALLPRGLNLVTGPTGSGKSTTLAAMIDHINELRAEHVITIEDPVEFVHRDKKATIEQRQLGTDTVSFAEALRHTFRATPDVVLVGEMRDLETIALAITAAETGHLVFATLHTTDAMQTVDRTVDVFPPQQQAQIRIQLSVSLASVISQQLLPIKGGGGRVPAFEIMICTPAIRAIIREGKTHMIYNMIQSGGDLGMMALDQYLADLVRAGKVEYEQALAKSSYPSDFAKRVGQYAATAAPSGPQVGAEEAGQ